MRSLQKQLLAYQPEDEAEAESKAEFLQQWELKKEVLLQRSEQGHVTVSAMILNPSLDAMLMVYHNIYQSLSWTGGHADGAEDLLQKRQRRHGKKPVFCN